MLIFYQGNNINKFRMLVGVIFFFFGIFTTDYLWLFNRSGNIDHEK